MGYDKEQSVFFLWQTAASSKLDTKRKKLRGGSDFFFPTVEKFKIQVDTRHMLCSTTRSSGVIFCQLKETL